MFPRTTTSFVCSAKHARCFRSWPSNCNNDTVSKSSKIPKLRVLHRTRAKLAESPVRPFPEKSCFDDKNKQALELTLQRIRKKYGKGAIQISSNVAAENMERIPTGSLTLDMALSGGVPRGKIIEIYGQESCGKTSLAISIMREAQKMYPSSIVALVDLEHAFDDKFARLLGLKTDADSCYTVKPKTGEEGMQMAEMLATGSPGASVIVIDSVSALTVESDFQRDIGEAQVGQQAKYMSNALKKLAPIAEQFNCTFIFINQLRMNIGQTYGNPETTSGGRALKYYASQRIDVRRKELFPGPNQGDSAIGLKVRAKVVKNKTGPPNAECTFDLYYDRGIDLEASTIDGALATGVVFTNGAHYYYSDEAGNAVKMGHGREKAIQFLKQEENSQLAESIRERALKKYQRSKSSFEPELSADEGHATQDDIEDETD